VSGPYRFAVIGRGYMGKRHVAAIERHARADVSTIIGRGEALDISGADAVIVSSPDATHPEYVTRLMPTGKFVVCEKPLARTPAEFEAIRGAARGLERRLAVSMNCRFRRRIQDLKSALERGDFGSVRLVRALYYANVDAVLQGKGKAWWLDYPPGILPFLHGGAIHAIDALRFLFGDVERVHCAPVATRGSAALSGDSFVIVLWFAGGPVANLVITGTSFAPNRLQIMLDAEQGSVDERDMYLVTSTHTPEARRLPEEDSGDVDRQLDHFIAVLDGAAAPLNTIDEAFQNFLVIRACEASAAAGTPVHIPHESTAHTLTERTHG
jgi:predicted dehydrogenase